MCNTAIHHRPLNGVVDPFPFSTFHLLRTCNRLMIPSTDIQAYYNIVKENSCNVDNDAGGAQGSASAMYNTSDNSSNSPILDVIETIPLTDDELPLTAEDTNLRNLSNAPQSSDTTSVLPQTETDLKSPNKLSTTSKSRLQRPTMISGAMGPLSMKLTPTLNILPRITANNQPNHCTKSPLPAFEYIAPTTQQMHHHQQQQHLHHPSSALNAPTDFPLMELNRVGVGMGMGSSSSMFSAFLHRRPRGEKRPIPDEQKDEKYYERRKRNNEAAKKSRDARKIREDRIAFRAALLEQENSILRAQVMALRDELQTMRQLIGSGVPSATTRSSMQQI